MIVRFLKWALSKFEPAQEEVVFSKAELKAWPFPDVSEDFEPRPKKKPTVKKATTRTKKPAVVAKTVRTKKAK